MKVNANEGFDEEGPFSPWVPPDDRLWRHPSEAPTTVMDGPFISTRHLGPRTWTTALVAGVVGALLASGIGVATGAFERTTVVRTYSALTSSTTRAITPAVIGPSTDWTTINEQLAASMVMISGNGSGGQIAASGMLWKQDKWGTAYVLAADEDLAGAGSVSVAFAGGQTAHGQVIGNDELSGISVIQVTQQSLPRGVVPTFPQIDPLTDVHEGEGLAAVGSQAQSGSSFVTGWVSSLDRSVTDSDSGGVLLGMIAVGTAGPVSHGTAVVSASGEVVGLTVEGGATDGDPDLVSYAVPMDLASVIATQIVDHEQPLHPWIGVLQAEDLLPTSASQMELSGGAVIDAVSPGSPAAQAGLSASDVIVSLDNTPVDSTGELLDILSGCTYRSWVSLRYLHQGKSVSTSIQVIAQPTSF